MGWFFQLEHANLVAYLTTPEPKTPQVTYQDLSSFLDGLRQGCKQAFISSDERWPEQMGKKAAASFDLIRKDLRTPAECVDHKELESLIGNLREELQKYDFYALAVFEDGDTNLNKRLLAFMKNGAYASKTHGIFLITDNRRGINYRFLDPFPPIQEIVKHPGNVPGVVFWNAHAATFVHLEDADNLLQKVMRAVTESQAAVTHVLRTFELGPPEKRILHLSDLHFGTKRATELEEFLMSSIAREAKNVDRIVVTGDLFDNPTAHAMNDFRNFRSQLERITNKDLIVIPGNHDESFKGNRLGFLGRMFKQVVSLEWSSLVIDPDMRCVFFAFDSALDAKISAQGIVTREQLIRVGTMYQSRLDRDPDLANYLSVALIHHHPFSWNANEPRIFGMTLEKLLYLENADEFLEWCARRRIPLILHGHKHVPRHVVEYFRIDGTHRQITSIGCGSSLGAEKRPPSYNILSWHPKTKNWSAAFFVDSGSASGFEQRYVSISNAQSN